MKKSITLFAVIFLIMQSSFAQTNTFATKKYVNDKDSIQQISINLKFTSSDTSNLFVTKFAALADSFTAHRLILNTKRDTSGKLPIYNGGTNNNFFTSGSILFFDGTKISESNSTLFFNSTKNFIGLGTASPTAQLHLAGNISASQWALNAIGIKTAGATYTDTTSSGTVTSMTIHNIATPTITATNVTTYTTASTWRIAAPPTAGSNVTITNPLSFWVDSGNSRFDGKLSIQTASGDSDLTVSGSGHFTSNLKIDGKIINDSLQAEMNSKTTVISFMGASSAQLTVLKNTTAWLSINGGTASTSETVAEYYVPFSGTLMNLYTYVSSSSTDANSTITLRKNGVSQTLEVTYTAGQTGLQSNTSSSFAVSQGDRIAVKATNGSGAGGAAKDLVLQSWSFVIVK